MILLVCLDQRDGIRFNHRRQSADRCVTERILRLVRDRKLYVQETSAPLFPQERIAVSSDLSALAASDDFYFFEYGDALHFADKVEKLIVFRWDKVYPADETFPMAYFRERFSQTETDTFPGYSHDMIIQEVYKR